MANIRLKPVTELKTWNSKELRKLRITIKNRIQAFEVSSSPRNLPKGHPLKNLETDGCKELLLEVMRAEKALAHNN